MAGEFTLPGVLLSGTHGARPAASAVANGCLYAETDTGQIVQSDGVSVWSAWGAAGVVNPMTNPDDLIVGGAAGIETRLAKGADGQVLTVDPATHHLVWVSPAAGALTTKGDILGFATLPARIPIGADTLVLTADSTQALGLKWAAGGGGGGGAPVLGLVQSAQVDASGGGSVVLPAAPTAGNLLIFVSSIAGADITGVSSTGTTWTQLADYVESGQQSGSLYKGVVGAGASATVSFTTTGAGYFAVWELTGKTASAIRGAVHGSGVWVAGDRPMVVHALAGDIVVAVSRQGTTGANPPIMLATQVVYPGLAYNNRGAGVLGLAAGNVVALYLGTTAAGFMASLVP